MYTLSKLLFLAATLPVCLYAQVPIDSTATVENEVELDEVVVVAHPRALKHEPDKIVYIVKNDPYAKGLNAIEALNLIPRVSVINEKVNVVGKLSVRYIIDGQLLNLPEDALTAYLRNIATSGIEKIEVLTTPPSRYGASANVAYISITTRKESLGTVGNASAAGIIRENFNYLLGANISHTTRKVEISADISWNALKGKNQLDRTYTFSNYVKTSRRTSRFSNRMLAANALFKYKVSKSLTAGAIVNLSASKFKSRLSDLTIDNGVESDSHNYSPARPNNALTLTAFSDWMIDDTGKFITFTYNYFNRYSHPCSYISTSMSDADELISDEGINKDRIHSAKLDAVILIAGFKFEGGASFTRVCNNNEIEVKNYSEGEWGLDPRQSNTFNYYENTTAAYISAEKSILNLWFAKLGLRYEYTDVKGTHATDSRHRHNSYGYILPSFTISRHLQNIGRFSLSYSAGLTRPDFADINPFKYYTTTTDYVAGNPDLGPTISHNAELNYSGRGIYAVLYNSYSNNAVGYVTRFNSDGSQYTTPENFIKNNKTGLYASYRHTLFNCWDLKFGVEVYHTSSRSKIPDLKATDNNIWSGKFEFNTSIMLNAHKTLIFSLHFTHYLPHQDRLIHFDSMTLLGCDIRYMLLNQTLTLSASVNDPFSWNITESTATYHDFTLHTRNNIHSHALTFRIAYSFGRSKVNRAYRDSKERESRRSH